MEATPINTKGYETLLDLVGWLDLAFELLKKSCLSDIVRNQFLRKL